MTTLHLTLKKRWYDMIYSGQKPEEYREIKPYWSRRLTNGKKFDKVQFKNGYRKDSPSFTMELKEITTGMGVTKGEPLKTSLFLFSSLALLLKVIKQKCKNSIFGK
ncbi:TPA: hypothetical protein PMB18_002144 [Vibrio cholerae]|nr:hypothetical protein [Vibrio cholerae]